MVAAFNELGKADAILGSMAVAIEGKVVLELRLPLYSLVLELVSVAVRLPLSVTNTSSY